MNFEKRDSVESIPPPIREFVKELYELYPDELTIEQFDDTYEIDTDDFNLSFVIEDSQFEIRNIDVRGHHGFGSKIIEVIHKYADNEGLEVFASNVDETAVGFWRQMGYEEGSEEDTYFRV